MDLPLLIAKKWNVEHHMVWRRLPYTECYTSAERSQSTLGLSKGMGKRRSLRGWLSKVACPLIKLHWQTTLILLQRYIWMEGIFANVLHTSMVDSLWRDRLYNSMNIWSMLLQLNVRFINCPSLNLNHLCCSCCCTVQKSRV